MKNKIKYLCDSISHNSIESISIFYEGEKIANIQEPEFSEQTKDNILFTVKDSSMKYVICISQIEDILFLPASSSIIIVESSNINIEIKIKKRILS